MQCILLIALLVYSRSLSKSSPSCGTPPYRHANSASPAASTAAWDEEGFWKISNFSLHSFVPNFFKATPFPMPKRRDVVSHPVKACTAGRICDFSIPTLDFNYLMSHIRLIFDDIDAKNKSLHSTFNKWTKRTRMSVSSPNTMTFLVSEHSTAVNTIKRSASPAACFTWNPLAVHLADRRFMKLCKFLWLVKKTSFFNLQGISSSNVTFGVNVPLHLLKWVTSLVEDHRDIHRRQWLRSCNAFP